jgi:DNA-binding GntR family transcriptional regulator
MNRDKMLQSPSGSSLNERTYLSLRASILSGEVGLGDRLVEDQLAQQLQVSRTPIREAIRRLQQEQLLTTDSPDGITIVKISLPSAIHLYDCRISLEQQAVQAACRHATAVQVQALKRNLAASKKIAQASLNNTSPSSSLQVNQSRKLLNLNYEFHRLIAESAQNPWLVFLLDQLANQVKLLRLQTLKAPINAREIQTEHEAVVDAIIRRDAEAATQCIEQHLEISQARIKQIFERQPKVNKERVTELEITCPRCGSDKLKKNGRRHGRQSHLCKQCGRQFLSTVPASRRS